MASERRVTGSRLGRLGQLGRLAGGIAGGLLSEGARQLASGRRPSVGELLLTPANAQRLAERLAERLSEMRGAAMKVGQLLSMDNGHLVPPQLSAILGRLREDAHRMPLGQVAQVLGRAWGDGWEREFDRFHFTPIAAASIGQVHRAELRGGGSLAIKVQYPGIRQSIDSDVDNVATLLRLSDLLPSGMDIAPMLTEAKQQLHREADYALEAAALTRFAQRLSDDPRFVVPAVSDRLTTPDVLAMEYLDGQPIENLAGGDARERNRVAAALLELALREVFDWGLVQTDPNFANFLYQPQTGRIQLLDFGATRAYPDDQRHALRTLLSACVLGDDADLAEAATVAGYLAADDPVDYVADVTALLRTVTEPARARRPYAFADTDLAQRMSDLVIRLRTRHHFGRLPPTALLFLHRKLGGVYLLLARLRATLPVGALIEPYLDPGRPQVATERARA